MKMKIRGFLCFSLVSLLVIPNNVYANETTEGLDDYQLGTVIDVEAVTELDDENITYYEIMEEISSELSTNFVVERPTSYEEESAFSIEIYATNSIRDDYGVSEESYNRFLEYKIESIENQKKVAAEKKALYDERERLLSEMVSTRSLSISNPTVITLPTDGNYVTSFNLKASDGSRYYKFTASTAGQYSFQTFGSQDTLGYFYKNGAFTGLKLICDDFQDGRGNGFNFCNTEVLKAGQTIYIEISCFDTISRKVEFWVNRGIPVGGYEHDMKKAFYEQNAYLFYNNCYTYALDVPKNKNNNYWQVGGVNPGQMTGIYSTGNWLNALQGSSASTVRNMITTGLDYDVSDYFNGVMLEWEDYAPVKEGYYKVFSLFRLGANGDYHFLRQLNNGYWSNKNGGQGGIYDYMFEDSSRTRITDPWDACDLSSYTRAGNCYIIKIPTNISPLSSSAASLEVNSNHRQLQLLNAYTENYNLTESDALTISVGDDREFVYNELGLPHEYIGSGLIRELYRTVDGYSYTFLYDSDEVIQICQYDNNNEFISEIDSIFR